MHVELRIPTFRHAMVLECTIIPLITSEGKRFTVSISDYSRQKFERPPGRDLERENWGNLLAHRRCSGLFITVMATADCSLFEYQFVAFGTANLLTGGKQLALVCRLHAEASREPAGSWFVLVNMRQGRRRTTTTPMNPRK